MWYTELRSPDRVLRELVGADRLEKAMHQAKRHLGEYQGGAFAGSTLCWAEPQENVFRAQITEHLWFEIAWRPVRSDPVQTRWPHP